MKKVFFLIISLFLYNSVYAQNSAPVVTNVQAEQRASTKLVEITYDVFDADGDILTISVEVSNDGGKTFTIKPVTLLGDVGSGIMSGTVKTIVWDAYKDCPEQYGTNFLVKVIADDYKDGVETLNDGYGDYVFVQPDDYLMEGNFVEGISDNYNIGSKDGYYIGKFEVTNGQYKEFIDDGGYYKPKYWKAGCFGKFGVKPLFWDDKIYKGGGVDGNENFPVRGVNWYEAMAYCCRLSEKTGKIYRLPTVSEWEHASKGAYNKYNPWDTGDGIEDSFNRCSKKSYILDITAMTVVGYYKKNNVSNYGAYDMAGNIWEWCLDWQGIDDISGPTTSTSRRTNNDRPVGYAGIRGGFWALPPDP